MNQLHRLFRKSSFILLSSLVDFILLLAFSAIKHDIFWKLL